MLLLPIIWIACYYADDKNKSAAMQIFRLSYPILAACALSLTQPVQASDNVETRVFLNNSCVIADEPVVVEDFDTSKALFSAGIVSGVSQAVIGNIIRGVAGVIRSSGRGKSHVYEAEQDIYLYRADFGESADAELNRRLACVTIVSGQFDGENVDCTSQYQPATMAMSEANDGAIQVLRASRSAANVLRRANICLVSAPHYVFESRMVLADDRSAFRMQGAGFEINRLQSARRNKDSRALLSTYSILEPSANGRGRLLANTWMQHGELRAGARALPMEDGNDSEWTRVPALSGAARKAYLADATPYEALEKETQKLESDILRRVREQSALYAQADLESESVAADLRRLASQLDTKIASQTAKLNAVRAEHDEMPKFSRDYMLVKIKVSITESKSEDAMKLWLANMIEANSQMISLGVTQSIYDSE